MGRGHKPEKQIITQTVKTIASSNEVKKSDVTQNTQKTIVKTIYRTIYRKDGGIQSKTKEVENIGSNTVFNQKIDDKIYRKEKMEEQNKQVIARDKRFIKIEIEVLEQGSFLCPVQLIAALEPLVMRR